MKQRFSSLDVKVIAHELNQSLVTLRLANVYDLSSKILLFKFAKPDNKKQLVVDAGFRCHLTEFARTTAAAPSAFVARLRKLLKTRRLTSVSQIGTDRIIEFQFSDGQYRLFLEFFASGNIILTDADLKILSLARNVPAGEGQEAQRVGLQYSLENRQNFHGIPPLTRERVQAALRSAADKAAAPSAAKKLKAKPGGDLRKSLAVSVTELPPVLVDHVLQSNDFDTTVNPVEILENNVLLDELVKLLSEAKSSVENITSSETCAGFIFAKRRGGIPVEEAQGGEVATNRDVLLYEDFHPFIPHKFQKDTSIKTLEFKGYNQTVDEYFSSLEGQKLETRVNEREAAAKRKLDAARADQARRIEGLQDAQALNMRKAAAIEANVEWVQEAMDAINGLLAQGMDWIDIGKLVEREKKHKNPLAGIIVLPLNLGENSITLNLAEEEEEEKDEEEGEEEANPFETDDSDSEEEKHASTISKEAEKPVKGLNIEINLKLSPWSNAREYYEQRRTAVVKEERTQQQASRALKNAEQKIAQDLKKGLKQEKALLQPIRRLLWFEKFLWFISSDGYLVLGGKDAHQNEILYKRYLRKGDVYCHADLRGAASVIIKNDPSSPDAPIPPATLAQAGNLSVCASEAWDQKAGMGAWWVKADQVSKSAPTGEFLPTGSFTVRGQKNYLAPAQLILGLGIMFKITEESKARHVKHRIHDVDPGLGSDMARERNDKPSIASVADFREKEPEDDVSQSDNDSDDGQEEENARANPLQTPGGAEDDEVEETAGAASSLNLTEQPADEGGSQEEAAETGTSRDEPNLAVGTDVSEAPTRTWNPTTQTGGARSSHSKKGPPKRGQKGKAKKAALKYKDQDEEDRAAAETLIGATAGQKRQEAEAKAKADRQAELEAARERRRAQHERRQKEIAGHEEIRRVMMEEGIDVLDADEAEKATPLDALVGTPLPGDEILEAVPVCAPWNALGKFKYKAKMQPGAVKKGKATKEIMERWKADSGKKGAVDESSLDSEKMWPREVELIKGMKVEEIVNCVPAGKVRVMMAGGSGGGGGGGRGKGSKGKAKK
ncbi:serologically defined colon cancer antigen 1 [Metarhizium album ARSEF 1941]|uniref:Ribosome quality control complex subunit 2 n=1 Tax=Metarhizium album (strain ARSEF 1941) TaxID=1081103 RepID=A0A0B2WKU1_METAS|nr:serologically defined colon cancer antigen 1 [Metarhizium album ARSEF 1941]KHN94254.1 serologically defined colon cancer antigen 1 [Metarhizium album ARSEF 1941]